jgi:CheY-like chemotaxis protein
MSVEATSGAGAPGLPMNTSAFGKTQKKVLVIDDTQDIRFIISETLNLFGFHTLTAEDGVTGISMAQENLPDLIICDINMPNLDGYGTLKAMREHEATAGIPFIFLSGATDKSDMRRGMELGADVT